MSLITIYFCINYSFIDNDLMKNYNGPFFKRRKLYAVSIFFGMAEHYHLHEGRSENRTVNLVLCLYAFFIKLNPSELSQFWLFIV